MAVVDSHFCKERKTRRANTCMLVMNWNSGYTPPPPSLPLSANGRWKGGDDPPPPSSTTLRIFSIRESKILFEAWELDCFQRTDFLSLHGIETLVTSLFWKREVKNENEITITIRGMNLKPRSGISAQYYDSHRLHLNFY